VGLGTVGPTGRSWAVPGGLVGMVRLRRALASRARGAVTDADVQAAPNRAAYAARVREWARSVWEAYASQQDLARAWMRAAIAGVSSSSVILQCTPSPPTTINTQRLTRGRGGLCHGSSSHWLASST